MRQQSTQMILDTTDMALTITSQGVTLNSIYAYSVQAIWSGGTVNGTFHLEGSNFAGDVTGMATQQPADTDYTIIADSTQVVTGSPGSILYDVTECSYRWVRLVFVPTGGSGGTLRATINTKGT